MRAYEAVWGALPEGPVCGRPEGHSLPHRSVQAVAAARLRDLSPVRAQQSNELRNARRRRDRLAAAQMRQRSRAA